MPLTEQERELLKRFENEYGSNDLSEGEYHATLKSVNKLDFSQALNWQVACGPSKGRRQGQFLGWSGETTEQTKIRRNKTLTAINTLAQYGGVTKEALDTMKVALYSAKSDAEALEVLGKIGSAFVGTSVAVKVTQKEGKDGNMYTNLYIQRPDKAPACECRASAVRV